MPFPASLRLRTTSIALFCSFAAPAMAVQVTDNLDLGGAIRARWDVDPDRDIQKFGLDTVFLSAKYNSDSWIGEAQYRFYGRSYPYQYTKNYGDIRFAKFAWVGYKFNPDQQVQVGLNTVPFGLQPYFGSTFYETLGNVIGLEDVQQIGTKYIQQSGDWNIQAGYYLRPAWQGKGTSKGVTYSSVVSEADSYVADGSNNQERNTVVLRVLETLRDLLRDVRIIALPAAGSSRTVDDHDRIVQAVLAQDRDGARQAMQAHLDDVSQTYARALSQLRAAAPDPVRST